MTEFEQWVRIWHESGAWRRFSFEDFVRTAMGLVAKFKKNIEHEKM